MNWIGSRLHRTLMASLLAALIAVGFCQPARADAASCDMDQYSFTVGLMYCVKQKICNATVGENCDGSAATDGSTGMMQALTTGLVNYKYLMIALTLTFFGLRIIHMEQGGELIRDGMMVLIKIAFAVFLVAEAPSLFLSMVGAIDELISFFSKYFSVVNPTCTLSATPPAGYEVWGQFDCIFAAMFGVATDPKAVLGSMLVVLLPGLFSGTLGVIIFMLGVNALFSVLYMLIRCLYLVLLSYITIAFLMLLTPLVGPLLMLRSQYTSDFFKKWVSTMLSTIFQPMYVIGFLSFAVLAIDTFIEGDIKGCVPGVAANPATGAAATPGSGVCSFKQLFNPGGSGMPTAAQLQAFIEPNATLARSAQTGDPQANTTNQQYQDAKTLKSQIKSGATAGADQSADVGGGIDFQGVSRLKPTAPLLQFITTLIAFFLVTIIMKQLMEIIPSLARQISLSIGIGLADAGAVPLASAFEAAGSGMNSEMMNAARNKQGFGSIVGSGLRGAFRGAMNDLGTSTGNVNVSGKSNLDSFGGAGGGDD